MHAVILAGGKGVRLRPYTTALPKPLVPLGEHHVILDVILQQLAAQGFTSVTLAINHLGRLIRAFVGDGAHWGLQVSYQEETKPLSTVGPLFHFRDTLPEHFLVVNGDILTALPFDDLLGSHISSGAPVTVATYATESRCEFGVLDILNGSICGFREKPVTVHNVSMGVYAMSRSAIDAYPAGMACGVDQLILDLIHAGRLPKSYPYSGLWMDIGRPEDYDRANEGFANLLSTLMPQRPVAIDLRLRDGPALGDVRERVAQA